MECADEVFPEQPSGYHLEMQLHDIPTETALKLGRLLVERGYEMVTGYIMIEDSPQTVASILSEFDNHVRYARNTQQATTEKNGIIGPYYSRFGGKEFCPIGIGVWLPKT